MLILFDPEHFKCNKKVKTEDLNKEDNIVPKYTVTLDEDLSFQPFVLATRRCVTL